MYKLPDQVLRGLLAYLSKRPYDEVFEGIQALRSLERIEEPESKE